MLKIGLIQSDDDIVGIFFHKLFGDGLGGDLSLMDCQWEDHSDRENVMWVFHFWVSFLYLLL